MAVREGPFVREELKILRLIVQGSLLNMVIYTVLIKLMWPRGQVVKKLECINISKLKEWVETTVAVAKFGEEAQHAFSCFKITWSQLNSLYKAKEHFPNICNSARHQNMSTARRSFWLLLFLAVTVAGLRDGEILVNNTPSQGTLVGNKNTEATARINVMEAEKEAVGVVEGVAVGEEEVAVGINGAVVGKEKEEVRSLIIIRCIKESF